MERLEKSLNKIYEEQPEKVKGLGGEDIPDVRHTLARFRASLAQDPETTIAEGPRVSGNPRAKTVNRFRMLAYAAGICVLLAVSVFVYIYMLSPSSDPNGDDIIGVINPMTQVDTITDAEILAGFAVETLAYLPEGYVQDGIYVIKIDNEHLIVRQSFVKSEALRINFDKTPYVKTSDNGQSGSELRLLYEGDILTACVWDKDGFEYGITAIGGIGKDEMLKVVSSIE